MKKITFLVLHLGYGGVESATINSANALCKNYEVEIISFYKLLNNQENNINKNVKIKYLYDGEPNKKEFMQCLKKHKVFKAFKEGVKAFSILRKKKKFIINELKKCDSFAIVSTRMEFSTLLSKYGKNNIIKIAQEHHHHNNDKKYIKTLSKKYYNIDYLFALTEGLKQDYMKFLEKNKHTKVIVVPNMLASFPDKKSDLKKHNLITVSRLDYGKRNNELIDIISKLNNDWKLFIIGDGKEYNNLLLQIEKLNLKDKVVLTGYKTKQEIEDYMLESSIFLMASVTEGLPMVLLEAMSYGIPCIAYRTDSGVSDIICNDNNGYVIKNRSEKVYIENLEKLIDSYDLRKIMGNNALETSKKYLPNEIIEIWDKVLNEKLKVRLKPDAKGGNINEEEIS